MSASNSDARKRHEEVSGIDLYNEHTGRGYKAPPVAWTVTLTLNDLSEINGIKRMLDSLLHMNVIDGWKHHVGVFVESLDGSLQRQDGAYDCQHCGKKGGH